MIITDIERTKRGRYSVFADGEFFAALHVEIYACADLKVGEEISEERLLELKAESERKITRDKALKLLSIKDYSRKVLIEKLERYAEREICEQTADKMQELGLLDDEKYAMAIARDLHNLKGYGNMRIIKYLREKGIDGDLAKEAASQFDEEEEYEKIKTILHKKCKKSLSDRKEYEKIFAYLMRMGYNYGSIKTAMSDFMEDEE